MVAIWKIKILNKKLLQYTLWNKMGFHCGLTAGDFVKSCTEICKESGESPEKRNNVGVEYVFNISAQIS